MSREESLALLVGADALLAGLARAPRTDLIRILKRDAVRALTRAGETTLDGLPIGQARAVIGAILHDEMNRLRAMA